MKNNYVLNVLKSYYSDKIVVKHHGEKVDERTAEEVLRAELGLVVRPLKDEILDILEHPKAPFQYSEKILPAKRMTLKRSIAHMMVGFSFVTFVALAGMMFIYVAFDEPIIKKSNTAKKYNVVSESSSSSSPAVIAGRILRRNRDLGTQEGVQLYQNFKESYYGGKSILDKELIKKEVDLKTLITQNSKGW